MHTAGIRQKLTGVGTIRPLLRFRLWFVPVVVVVLLLMGWWMRSALERSVRARTADGLQAVLDANVTALELWLRDQRAYAEVLAETDHVRAPVGALEGAWRKSPGQADVLLAAGGQAELRRYLSPLCEKHDFDGYAVVAPDGTMIAGNRDDWIGVRIAPDRVKILARVLAGETLVSHPFFVQISASGESEESVQGNPVIMIVAAPVQDDDGRVIAMLALVIDPDLDFTRILQSARLEKSGETYAFDSRGLLISHSRFDDELRGLGLIPAEAGSSSLLTLEIRDPGGSLSEGFVPTSERDAQPLTRMAASAVAGQNGVDVEGYRDYRGVMVAGAWEWLEEYDFGVVSEIDLTEALVLPEELRRTFWVVIGLFVLGAGVALGGTMFLSRLGRQMSDALLKARKLGQYTLEEKLGEGGMGQVFRARHAMLRRPTAIKLMHPDRAGKQALARFEREVQMTSRLTHPNTIAIFDYGRTPDGVFYYAMEYLPGIDLARLVEIDGAQPEGRVIHILRQVCGSLAEAHSHGLIHRDIKPENVILCERGGRHDVAKVLDFGIVKEIGGGSATQLTAVDAFTGTPLYVAPEAWSKPDEIDARADLYALAVVGYLMLTGERLFEADSVMDMYRHHVNTPPVPLSERLGRTIAPDLERVILRCLDKDPANRPQNAQELADELSACAAAADWTEDAARAWWADHESDVGPSGDTDATEVVSTPTSTVVVNVD